MRSLGNRIRSLLRWGRVSADGDDSGDFPTAQVSYLGKEANTIPWFPYGYHANVPEGTLGVLAAIQGLAEDRILFAGSPDRRWKNLGAGDVIVFSHNRYSYVRLNADGQLGIGAFGNCGITTFADRNDTSYGDHDILIGGDLSVVSTGGAIGFATGSTFTLNCLSLDVNNSLTADFSGAVQVNGNLTCIGTFVVNGADFMSHTHSGVTTGSGDTGGVN